MKYVILLSLFTFNTLACNQNSVAGLNDCQVKDLWVQLLQKIRPDVEYTLDENDTKTPWQRLTMENKPTLAEMQTELAAWKALKMPRAQLLDDVKGLKYKREAMVLCGYNIPNAVIFFRDIEKDMNRTKLDCLISKQAEIQAEIDTAKTKETQRGTLKRSIKDENCGPLNGYLKKLCQYNKINL